MAHRPLGDSDTEETFSTALLAFPVVDTFVIQYGYDGNSVESLQITATPSGREDSKERNRRPAKAIL